MGAVIWMIENGAETEISPGWNKQMATWLYATPHQLRRESWAAGELGGICHIFTADAIPVLEKLSHDQLSDREDLAADYRTSLNWTACFNRIITEIRARGEAVIRIDW